MIIYKPEGIHLPDQIVEDAYYDSPGAMRVFCIGGETHSNITPDAFNEKGINNDDSELIITITRDYPEIYINKDLSFIQSGPILDLGLSDEINYLNKLSVILSQEGFLAILELLYKKHTNGSWLKIENDTVSRFGVFIEQDGLFLSRSIKKKPIPQTTPPPLPRQEPEHSKRGCQLSPPDVSSHDCRKIGGVLFEDISVELEKFIKANSPNHSCARFAYSYIKNNSGIGRLQDFGFCTHDIVVAVSFLNHDLFMPNSKQIEDFIANYGSVRELKFTVIRLDDDFRYTQRIALSLKDDTIELTDMQRRFITSFLARRNNIPNGDLRDAYIEDLNSLSDSDLANQDGVEKSGYKQIK